MGYYSNLALERHECDCDKSYPTPEKQLLWRLDDLYDRLDFLVETGASYNSGTRLSDDDISYAVPNYFDNISDIERAIELAMSELNFQKIIFYSSSNIKESLPLQKKDFAICRICHRDYEYEEVQK